jgi:hypothetical protein
MMLYRLIQRPELMQRLRDNPALAAAAGTPNNALQTNTPTPTATPGPTATATPLPNHYIWVPWRSQYDGTNYAAANCGPACLSMAMSYYGEWWSTKGVRKSTNDISGVIGIDEGTDWPSLSLAAKNRGFTLIGLYDDGPGYHKWTIDELSKQIEQEHPVILLVRYRDLLDHENSTYYGDHYIVFLGTMADGRVVYHDPAFQNEKEGAYKIMGQKEFIKAWTNTSVGQVCTGMALVWEQEGRKWDDPAAVTPTAPTPGPTKPAGN